MTPEQGAAFINAQAALLLTELEVLKAKDTMLAIQPPDGRVEVIRNSGQHAREMEQLYQKYEGVLGYNAVIDFFGQINYR